MSNLHITRVGVEKKFGKKIPVHKIEKMFGKIFSPILSMEALIQANLTNLLCDYYTFLLFI